MEQEQYQNLLNKLNRLENQLDRVTIKKIDFHLFKRVIIRLESLSKECKTCQEHLARMDHYTDQLIQKQDVFNRGDYKEHKKQTNEIIVHLQKVHKLVPPGYYVGTYMSLGTSLGLVFGMTLLDNLALGLPIGISIGLMIGSSMDADAKKKGLTI